MTVPRLQFPPPKEVRILSVVQVMFIHPQTKNASVCKVELGRLNAKLQKLQKEGMQIVGIFVTDLEKECQPQPHSSGGTAHV